VTLASHPPGESPKSANARHLLQNMSLNRVEDFFIADVGMYSPKIRDEVLDDAVTLGGMGFPAHFGQCNGRWFPANRLCG
jgi:hypothetical protein